MAEAFVKPSNATTSGSARYRMPELPLLSSIAGWKITTPCTRIPDWATNHPASTSLFFPNRRLSGLTISGRHNDIRLSS
jgi:hypothetical protein